MFQDLFLGVVPYPGVKKSVFCRSQGSGGNEPSGLGGRQPGAVATRDQHGASQLNRRLSLDSAQSVHVGM